MAQNTYVEHIDFDIAKDRMIKLSDIAKMLNKSRITIERWVKEDKFPQPVRIGGSLRWVERHVKNWLEEQTKR